MKNNKAILKANLIYVMLTIAFIIIMSAFIWAQSRGAATWSDYYAKEITRLVNSATPGQEITLDIHRATVLARGNEVGNFETIFEFNNRNNEVCVKLSHSRKNCYKYFNEVDIVDYEIIYGRPENTLKFRIQEKPLGENNEQ